MFRSFWRIVLTSITLLISFSYSADYQLPSFDPPGGLAVDSCPLFIVLGFDDNRYVDGMEWTLELLEGKMNPEGTGNSQTFDGAPIKAAFYHTSNALDEDNGDLLNLWKLAYERGHEVADHTVTHNTSKALSQSEWESEISGCRTALSAAIGVPESEIVGFRTPYLDFNAATFEAVAALGMLYECTMTQMQDYNASKFVWPYTLDEGFAEKTISGWPGQSKIPGLWELPVYTIGEDPVSMWPPITGFDSSVLTQANGSKYEQMLKNAIDYRMKEGGNRAPLTVGLHSDTYAASNPSGSNYDQALDLAGRQAALSNFIKYALTVPEVRFVTGVQLIEWMRNPIPLGRPGGTTIAINNTNFKSNKVSINPISASLLNISATEKGIYSLNIINAAGQKIYSDENINLQNNQNRIKLNNFSLPTGAHIAQISSDKVNSVSKLIIQ